MYKYKLATITDFGGTSKYWTLPRTMAIGRQACFSGTRSPSAPPSVTLALDYPVVLCPASD